MNTGPAFWVIMTAGATVLLGVALAYALIFRRNRGAKIRIAQVVTTAATHEGGGPSDRGRKLRQDHTG